MHLQQCGNDFERFTRIPTSFETQTNQIHPDESRLLLEWFARPGRVISDRHAMFIDALLEAPAPIRRMTHHTVGLGNLIDLDMRAMQGGAAGVEGGGKLQEGLGLAAPTIAVLREKRPAVRRPRSAHYEGITHRQIRYRDANTRLVERFDRFDFGGSRATFSGGSPTRTFGMRNALDQPHRSLSTDPVTPSDKETFTGRSPV
jgi:hypothetical protein